MDRLVQSGLVEKLAAAGKAAVWVGWVAGLAAVLAAVWAAELAVVFAAVLGRVSAEL